MKRVLIVLLALLLLAACSSTKERQERTNRIETATKCDQLSLDQARTRLGFAVDKDGHPIDEADATLGYERVNIDCNVQLVDLRQPPVKEENGRKYYRLYQGSDESFWIIDEEHVLEGTIEKVIWKEETLILEQRGEPNWYVVPTHAFRCYPRESQRPDRDFACEGQVVRGLELSTYEGKAWSISAGASVPTPKGVKLKFTGSTSEKTDRSVVVKQGMASFVYWNAESPTVWNALLTRQDQATLKGTGKICYIGNNCLDWAEIHMTISVTSFISTRTNGWMHLLAQDGDWRKIIQGADATYHFEPGPEPVFSLVVPNDPQREEILGNVPGVALSWQKKHTFMNDQETTRKGEAELGMLSASFGEVVRKARGDGTSTAVEMKYVPPDHHKPVCVKVMEVVNEDPPFTGISLEGCR